MPCYSATGPHRQRGCGDNSNDQPEHIIFVHYLDTLVLKARLLHFTCNNAATPVTKEAVQKWKGLIKREGFHPPPPSNTRADSVVHIKFQ